MRPKLFLAVIAAFVPCATMMACSSENVDLKPAPLESLRVTLAGMRILDANGRQVILRGVNAGSRAKLPPYFPFEFRESHLPEQSGAPPFEDALASYLDRVEAWGHNVLRLPFSWEAVEPERGQYDELYLDRYGTMIDAAEARGIRVIVDFHQDVFARPYCGNGFPIWTLAPPVPERPAECGGWFVGYLTDPRVKRAFDRFWANEDGLADAFAAMWQRVAERTWPREGVIGFEVINEPAAGTADEQRWAETVLAPFYADMAAVIRSRAPGAPVFVDVTAMDAISAETALPAPQAHPMIFAPHFYDGSLFLGEGWAGDDPSEPLGRWRSMAEAWAVPMILGEFGAPIDEVRAAEYLRRCYLALDDGLTHATIWEYSSSSEPWNDVGFSLVDRAGAERPHAVEAVRPYPAAVAGAIRSFAYDPVTRTGVLAFDAEAGVPTEIAAPRRLFPDDLDVELEASSRAAWVYDRAAQRLLIEVDTPGPVTATFTARGSWAR